MSGALAPPRGGWTARLGGLLALGGGAVLLGIALLDLLERGAALAHLAARAGRLRAGLDRLRRGGVRLPRLGHGAARQHPRGQLHRLAAAPGDGGGRRVLDAGLGGGGRACSRSGCSRARGKRSAAAPRPWCSACRPGGRWASARSPSRRRRWRRSPPCRGCCGARTRLMPPEFALAAIGFAALLALIALRAPVGLAMLLAGAGGYLYIVDAGTLLNYLKTTPYHLFANYTLSVIPLFILMGALAERGGLARDLFDAANALFGRKPGGMAMGGDRRLRLLRRGLRQLRRHHRHLRPRGAAGAAALRLRPGAGDRHRRGGRHARHPDPAFRDPGGLRHQHGAEHRQAVHGGAGAGAAGDAVLRAGHRRGGAAAPGARAAGARGGRGGAAAGAAERDPRAADRRGGGGRHLWRRVHADGKRGHRLHRHARGRAGARHAARRRRAGGAAGAPPRPRR